MIFILGSAVFIGYTIAILLASFRHRREPEDRAPGATSRSLFIPIAGILIPILLLIPVYVLNVASLNAIPFKIQSNDLVVDVIGHQWWWEIH